ncbi:MAG: hypothetical protein A2Y95_04145 [Deltaproteobacteria bacterium RBG_13_65_10]|nr:MAG: hypothetical protein A2Y95_04145 [Deltaproteobacteria bacterium RBG_13_65_10]
MPGLRLAYNLAVALAACPVLAWKSARDRSFRATVPERLGRLPDRLPDAPVWVHCASVGEVRAAARVVDHLGFPVIVSTMTPAGLALARSLFPRAVTMTAPLDLAPLVGRALDRIAPRLLVIVETEIWPELILGATARDLPVALISARISDRTAAAYRRARAIFGPALRAMSAIGAQTQTDRERLVAIGADPDRVWVTGNLKFDAPPQDGVSGEVSAIFSGAGPWLVAGSTHPGEEAAALDALDAGRAVEPRLRLVIAPRHLARLPEVDAVLSARGVRAVRRSSLAGPPPAEVRVIVLDTIGELDAVYAHARIAFVGGSLVPVGGHNVLEPARHGRPILVGPHTRNFRVEMELLLRAGAAARVPDAQALAREVRALLADPARAEAMGEAGRRVLEQGRGATERTRKMLAPLLGPGAETAS